MVRSRFEYVMLAACAVLLAGCAAGGAGAAGGGGGGGGGGGDAAAAQTGRPRSDTNTNSAEFFLLRAPDAENPAEIYQQALDAARNGVLQNPNNPLAYLLAGRAHIGLGQYLAADSMLTRAEQLYPQYLEQTVVHRENAWIDLFNASLEAADAAGTIQLLETAEKIFPGMRPEAQMNLGITYGNEERYDHAVEAYEAALQVIRGPRIEEVDSATAAGWRMRERSVALNQATILAIAERLDDAAGAYVRYLESAPDDVQALVGLAGVLARAERADSAQAIYESLLERPGLSIREYQEIGVGLYTAAQAVDTTVADPKPIYQEAAKAFQAVVNRVPRSRDAVFNLAQSLFDAQDWEALLPVTAALMELDGYNPQVYLLRAFALDRTGDQEAGIEVYARTDSLAFNLDGYSLQSRTGGGATVSANLTNHALEPGTTVELLVHFSAEDGSEIGTADISVGAPAQGEVRRVEADLDSDVFIVGYYIEVLSPR